MFTAAAVASVTIVLYSVIVLIPAPLVLVSLVCGLTMVPALGLTNPEEAEAARILSRDLLDQRELAWTRVSGAGVVSHVQAILSGGGQSLGQAEGEVWVLDMENLLGLLRDPGVEEHIGPGAGARGRKRSGERKFRQN